MLRIVFTWSVLKKCWSESVSSRWSLNFIYPSTTNRDRAGPENNTTSEQSEQPKRWRRAECQSKAEMGVSSRNKWAPLGDRWTGPNINLEAANIIISSKVFLWRGGGPRKNPQPDVLLFRLRPANSSLEVPGGGGGHYKILLGLINKMRTV